MLVLVASGALLLRRAMRLFTPSPQDVGWQSRYSQADLQFSLKLNVTVLAVKTRSGSPMSRDGVRLKGRREQSRMLDAFQTSTRTSCGDDASQHCPDPCKCRHAPNW